LNKLDADSLIQILANFVKLDCIDVENFYNLQKLAFEYAKTEGINNKQSIFSLFSSNFIFYSKIKKQAMNSKLSIKKKKELKYNKLLILEK
jgi:hypothetical protein